MSHTRQPSHASEYPSKKPRLEEHTSALNSETEKVTAWIDDGIATDFVKNNPTIENNSSLPDAILASLLSSVYEFSRITPPENLSMSISQYPELRPMLQKALEEKSFRPIRELLELLRQSPRGEKTHASRRKSGGSDTDSRGVVERAWETEYRGSLHILLLKNILQMERDAPYATTVPIVQSSGTGKSRMADELADHVFTIPFNLRDEADSGSNAFPDPDSGVRNYFLRGATMSEHDIAKMYLEFFASLFVQVEKLVANGVLSSSDSHQTFAQAWKTYLKTPIPRDAAQTSSSASGSMTRRQALYDTVLREIEESRDSKKVTGEATKKALSSLLNLIPSVPPPSDKSTKHGLSIVIYFDEAHVLVEEKIQGGALKNRYEVLLSCLEDIREPGQTGLFSILLSTVSTIAEFAKPAHAARSARVAGRGIILQGPITEVAFDCAPPISKRVRFLKDIATIEYISRFGRPLFWTWVKASHAKHEVIDLARRKLLCSDLHKERWFVWNHQRKDSTKHAPLAMADVLLNFDFKPNASAMAAEEALVASHMRLVYSVPQHRHWFWSGYSSEPILAEAALQQLEFWKEGQPSWLAQTVGVHLKNNLIDIGERGEIIIRILLIEAMIRARQMHRERRKSSGQLIEDEIDDGVSVAEFIEALFSSDHAQKILQSTPRDGDQVFSEVFKNAVIRFNHFVKLEDDHAASTKGMCLSFGRSMAVIACQNHEMVDIYIPILLDKHSPLSARIFSAWMFQIKFRAQRISLAKTLPYAERLSFFPKRDAIKFGNSLRPYISSVHDLGVRPPKPAHARPSGDDGKDKQRATDRDLQPRIPPRSTSANPPQPTPSDLRIPKRPGHPMTTRNKSKGKPKHPAYHIVAVGCSPYVYAVIDGAEGKKEYDQLLANRDHMVEHPRTDENSIGALRNMRPALSKSSLAWEEDFEEHLDDDESSANLVSDNSQELEDALLVYHEIESDEEDKDMFLE